MMRSPPHTARERHTKSPRESRKSHYSYGSLPVQHEPNKPCPPNRKHFQLGWPMHVLFAPNPPPTRPGRSLRKQDLHVKRGWMVEEGHAGNLRSDTMRYTPRKQRDAAPKPDDYTQAGFLKPLRLEGCALSPRQKGMLTSHDMRSYSRPMSGVRDQRNSRTFVPIVGPPSGQRVSDMGPHQSALPLVNFTPRGSQLPQTSRRSVCKPPTIVRQIGCEF